MMENQIGQLLDEVKTIVVKNRAENYKQGKEFNVFYVQGIASDEVRVCRFIRELIDPKGSHGQGPVFLRGFIKNVLKLDESSFTDEDYSEAHVSREELIDESRRIDLVVRIKDRLFPIEVKVYAKDQDRQCLDYYNYAVNMDPDTKIYYLTLDGHEPSDESRQTLLESQYECISFSDEILKWLDECIGADEILQIYSIKEVLIQFRSIIRDLTGMQKGKLRMEIKNLIESSYNNVTAAFQVANTLPDVKTDKMNEVFECIKKHMAERGYKEPLDSYENGTNDYYRVKKNRPCPGLSYAIPIREISLQEKFKLRFEIDGRLYFGICPEKRGVKTEESEKYIKDNLRPENVTYGSESPEWYWWAYLHKESAANYYDCNEDYLKLYDEASFQQYMKEAYEMIDSVIDQIMGDSNVRNRK